MNFRFLSDSPWKSQLTHCNSPNKTISTFKTPISKNTMNHNQGGDRFIPNYVNSNLFDIHPINQSNHKSLNLEKLDNSMTSSFSSSLPTASSGLDNIPPLNISLNNNMNYSSLLQMQILSNDIDLSHQYHHNYHHQHNELKYLSSEMMMIPAATPIKRRSSILKFKYDRNAVIKDTLYPSSPFSNDPLPSFLPKSARKIEKSAYKILDAPSLADDYYLNLLDWSSTNNICIGLDSSVYIWSASTNKAQRIYDSEEGNPICSVAWNQRASHLAIGDSTGIVKIFDVDVGKVIREMNGHNSRVGSLAWSGNILCTGSRDKSILQRDIRSTLDYHCKFKGHKQEICGLKWSYDNCLLASGGNDNKVIIWNTKTQNEVIKFSEHKAAVKALAWSPHNHNILATGGGKTDKTIKFWNLSTLKMMDSIDVGSQVCNMMFSINSNELVSTHGYSQNEINVWNYPTMENIASLIGHTSRVLYLGMSPDGENIVTGAGDETLRFWNIFPKKKTKDPDIFERCLVQPSSIDLR